MAVNKNFVVKNGLEVGSRLIVADSQDLHVGLGTTAPLTRLDVRGDVRFADDGGIVNTVDIAGITTFRKDVVIGVGATVAKFDIDSGNLGIHSSSPRFALDVRAGAGDTLAATFDSDIFAPNLVVSGGSINYIVAIAATTGTLNVTGIATAGGPVTFFDNLRVLGVTTLAESGGITTTGGDLYVGGDLFVADDIVYDEVTGRNINITGVSTFGTVQISSGIVTATSGVVTYFGDGSNLTGFPEGSVGVSSGGTLIGTAATIIDFAGVNATVTATPTVSGVSTVTVTPGVSLGLVIALGA
tara:strand:- start:229 stop:1125 length:897 start_codon:yes stop_codon:yes gene_type:complete